MTHVHADQNPSTYRLGSNRILDNLSDADRKTVMSKAQSVPLKIETVLQEQDERVQYSYFPTSGLISLLAVMQSGAAVEVGCVGCEGATGLSPLFGETGAAHRMFVQADGEAIRVPVSELVTAFHASESLRAALLRYSYSMLKLSQQGAACNAIHSAEERLARWLLMVQDRVQCEELQLTHEFLSLMLGVRRATVTVTAGTLEKAGLIEQLRGKIKILSRTKVQDASCECYEQMAASVNDGVVPNGANTLDTRVSARN